MWLLDTNIASELSRLRPDAMVIEWLRLQNPQMLRLSVVTLAELRYGVETCGDIAKRQRLEAWLVGVRQHFAGRVAGIAEETLVHWQAVIARCNARRYTIPQGDSLIAATAVHHRLTLATRNVSDFSWIPDLTLFNPFDRPATT